MSLTTQLLEANQANRAQAPDEFLKVMDDATQALVDQQIEDKAPKKGDQLPGFTLPDAKGETVTFEQALNGKNFAVITFYRGGWCPYCNLELNALQSRLSEIEALGASLVAITPETPDNSLTTSEKHNLAFPVLSDIDNTYARQLGMVFTLPENLQEVYGKFGLDLEKHNGNDKYELPLPATFVADASGNILHAFTPADYTKRLDPDTILEVLRDASVSVA